MSRSIDAGRFGVVEALMAVILAACAMDAQATSPVAPSSVPRIPPSNAPATPAPVTNDEVAQVLVGSVKRVIDGDTIMVRLGSGPITVRLASIDAPEHDQPGGEASTAALARRLLGRQVEIAVQTQDKYDRLVAFVYLGGESINAWQVQQGNAWAYRRYMRDPQYCAWEADARTYRRGLWSALPDSPQAPWEWRQAQREPRASPFTDFRRETISSCVQAMRQAMEQGDVVLRSSQPAQPIPSTSVPGTDAGCLIKGNISQGGKVYHVPGSKMYERVRIDERQGERWFCTEQEARAAGWRPPRG